ncbi:hypothetical protein UAY_01795 [Enterococcus moraviensis ATCC BAA-383]|uniref:Uncharacterized protein n=1 Tax=Enterococcus moraviensis ATCC BAA-383 TaxID=1158609 RepID=R2TKR2_9ENTE|nr:hypothetical protein [Enterococcus moraviensis]EOI00692.1 hypothetical protein UAY_01795 [Enterococcus moraviensis ATCC BAA-383]EOT73079.1 hypothetical protein I586_00072 [Enterococcus moraviensis ATCC BAA-383]
MTKDKKIQKTNNQIKCGLIMPLAPMPGYPDTQFFDVRSILSETISNISQYDFKPRMVSDSPGEIDIIHNSIVNNIYDDPIVVVDISGRNGNVMLELGLRLAFDKPVVIIKDDRTDYMFDISMIEHVSYPADLRHTQILEFQEKLQLKIVKTYEKSLQDKDYSPFLKNFKHIKVQSIGEETIDQDQALSRIDGKLDMMSKQINNMYSYKEKNPSPIKYFADTGMVQDVAELMVQGKIPIYISPEEIINRQDFKELFSKYSSDIKSRGFSIYEVQELLNASRNSIQ